MADAPGSPASRLSLTPPAVWAPTEDGLIASIGTWYGVARGAAAATLRTQLLDGSGAVTATVGTAPMLRTLRDRGVFEDGDGAGEQGYRALLSAETGTPAAELAGFAADRAGCVGIDVQGKDEFCDVLAGLLRSDTDLSHTSVDLSRTPVAEPVPADRLAVVVVADAEEQAALVGLNVRMIEAGSPWLLVDARGGTPAVVGPLFVPPDTGCLDCLWSRRAALTAHPAEYRALLAGRTAGPAGPWQRHMLAGLAAAVVLGWVLAADPWLPGACFELGVAQGPAVQRHEFLPVPGCEACRGGWRSTPAEDSRRFRDA
jgi:bacteriocin biosynthesis cyclodehydratase domain-containing protein